MARRPPDNERPPRTSHLGFDASLATVGTTVYRGNVFSGPLSGFPEGRRTAATTSSVFLPPGQAGTLAVTVRAANINSDGVPNSGGPLDQDFALVLYNGVEQTFPQDVPAGTTLVSEGCGSGNGAVDPGERVTVSFALANVGTAPTTNLVATLLEAGGVTLPTGPQDYGVLLAGGCVPIPKGFDSPEPAARIDAAVIDRFT